MFSITEFEAKDIQGLKVVCKKVNGIWKFTNWGAVVTPSDIYYCRTCDSGNREQHRGSTYSILNFNDLVSEIDPKQPAPLFCYNCIKK